jgi:hypothetical protein
MSFPSIIKFLFLTVMGFEGSPLHILSFLYYYTTILSKLHTTNDFSPHVGLIKVNLLLQAMPWWIDMLKPRACTSRDLRLCCHHRPPSYEPTKWGNFIKSQHEMHNNVKKVHLAAQWQQSNGLFSIFWIKYSIQMEQNCFVLIHMP